MHSGERPRLCHLGSLGGCNQQSTATNTDTGRTEGGPRGALLGVTFSLYLVLFRFMCVGRAPLRVTSVGEGKGQAAKSLQLVTGVQRSLIRMYQEGHVLSQSV